MEMLIQPGIPWKLEDPDLKLSLPSWVPDWSREMFNFSGGGKTLIELPAIHNQR